MGTTARVVALMLVAASVLASAATTAPAALAAPIEWVGETIPVPLTDAPGDPARGRAIVVDRQRGLCLLCHSGPFPEEPTPGNLSTDLGGAGSRWSAAQLRARLVDARRLNPASLMPAFHATDGRNRVGPAWRGRPILDAREIEDVIAFLLTLR
jgi:L-cysteine S-thiosulfotransferase